MRVDELTIEVRDGSLARVGQILPSEMVGFEAVLRFNNVGAWKITLPSNHVMADALRAPGAGIIVTSEIGVILSGPTVAAKQTKTAADPIGIWEITGSDDSIILGERLVYPDPANSVDAQTADFDERTGAAETVIKAYVNANIGPSAPVARRASNLIIEADLGRGEIVTGQARFDTLGPFIESLASTSSLGFTIEQNGSDLEFQIFEPTDRSAEIRMDVDNARLEKSEYTYTQPSVTRVVVAGPVTGTTREFIERTSTESLAAESDWARRIEVFKDARGNSDADALALAGDELLTDGGYTVESVSVSPNDNQTMAYGIDWGLGDKVTVVVGNEEIVQIVTEVALVITTDGIKIGATVGNVKAAARQDIEARNTEKSQDQETRISNLERNDGSSANGGNGNGGNNLVETADIADGAVTSAKIADGTIVNADVSGSAAIATSKIAGLNTALAGKAALAGADFTGTIKAPIVSSLSAAGSGVAVTNSNTASNVVIFTPYLNGTAYNSSQWYFDVTNNRWANEANFINSGNAIIGGDLTITGSLTADDAYVTSGVATASSGWTLTSALFRRRNGIAMLNLGLTRTGASLAAGNITNVGVCSLNVGFRPASESLAGGGPTGPVTSAYINAAGGVFITALGSSLASGDGVDINATFILA
jgi:hypothetical protein